MQVWSRIRLCFAISFGVFAKINQISNKLRKSPKGGQISMNNLIQNIKIILTEKFLLNDFWY